MTVTGRLLISLAALGALTACETTSQAPEAPFEPVYEGVDTALLDGDLVNFFVAMRGARDTGDVEDYARCAAAQYALIRGYGFARHLRTNVAQPESFKSDEAKQELADLNADLMVVKCSRSLP